MAKSKMPAERSFTPSGAVYPLHIPTQRGQRYKFCNIVFNTAFWTMLEKALLEQECFPKLLEYGQKIRLPCSNTAVGVKFQKVTDPAAAAAAPIKEGYRKIVFFLHRSP